jgi:hypothetical protein
MFLQNENVWLFFNLQTLTIMHFIIFKSLHKSITHEKLQIICTTSTTLVITFTKNMINYYNV